MGAGSSKTAGKKKIEKGRSVATKNTFPELYQQEQERKKRELEQERKRRVEEMKSRKTQKKQ